MDPDTLAHDALRELSGCKYISYEFIRGAIVAAMHQRGVPKDEELVKKVTPLVVDGLKNLGFLSKERS